jgi:hypothetical protein
MKRRIAVLPGHRRFSGGIERVSWRRRIFGG